MRDGNAAEERQTGEKLNCTAQEGRSGGKSEEGMHGRRSWIVSSPYLATRPTLPEPLRG